MMCSELAELIWGAWGALRGDARRRCLYTLGAQAGQAELSLGKGTGSG